MRRANLLQYPSLSHALSISLPDTIRDSLQAEAITKEVPVSQVFDFSYLPAR